MKMEDNEKQLTEDTDFLGEIIAQICDYAVGNNMSPTLTVRIVGENLVKLTTIASFENWKRRE